MDNSKNIKESYINNFKDFENNLNGESDSSFHKIRRQAIKKFSELDFPDRKNEEWRCTNISPLLQQSFSIPSNHIKLNIKDVSNHIIKDLDAYVMIFVNGKFSIRHSQLENIQKGIKIRSLADCIKNNDKDLLQHFGKYADYKNNIFTSLSTAFTTDGAFINVDDNCVIEKPIYLLFLTKAGNVNIQTQPRNLIVTGKNSQLTVIEHFSSSDNSIYFTNTITEIVAKENAVIDHIKLQEESINAFHIARMEIVQERNSNFTSHLISIWGKLSRNDINSKFNDEGGETILNGLFLIEKDQLFDIHSFVDHAKPNCNSNEHYKGILDDDSRGVFNGKIIVRKDAQKTNAFQKNNNILLSKNSLINTKPQLEIFADDVKCSHGATKGQLNNDATFYLKSRGIGEEASKVILLHAFASDIINHIKVDAVKNYAKEIINKRINKIKKEN